jgi:hypothetical protein
MDDDENNKEEGDMSEEEREKELMKSAKTAASSRKANLGMSTEDAASATDGRKKKQKGNKGVASASTQGNDEEINSEQEDVMNAKLDVKLKKGKKRARKEEFSRAEETEDDLKIAVAKVALAASKTDLAEAEWYQAKAEEK